MITEKLFTVCLCVLHSDVIIEKLFQLPKPVSVIIISHLVSSERLVCLTIYF